MTITYAIPDIHGCYEQMIESLSRIETDANGVSHKVVFLGDYIDRGPHSAQVMMHVREGIAAGKPWVALKGNHEDFFASAVVDQNEMMQQSWLMNGGRETLNSFGGTPMGELALWAKHLPIYHEDAHRVYVHAFAPEQYDMAEAPEQTILWARYPNGADVGYRGKHVVHGHTPMKSGPELYERRTNLDCGAVFGGRLCVGVFRDDIPGGPIRTLEVR